MRKDIEQYELIEQYLGGGLRGEELSDFEQRLEDDATFAQEVKNHKKLINIIEVGGFMDLKASIHDIHTTQNIRSKKRRIQRYSILGTSIAILLMVLVININKRSTNDLPQPVFTDTTETHIDSIHTLDSLPTKQQDTPEEETEEEPAKLPELPPVEDHSELPAKSPPKIDQADSIAVVAEEEPTPPAKEEARSPIEPVKQEITENDPCDGVEMKADISITNSCDTKPTGEIRIDINTISGGEGPFQFSLNTKNYHSNSTFENLYPKMYQVHIIDKNGCTGFLGNYIVESIECSYEYAFAPDYNEVWEIPLLENTGDIRIFNKNGSLVYEQVFDFAGEYSWDGRSNNGESLPMGIYLFHLNLNGTDAIIGNVTIIR